MQIHELPVGSPASGVQFAGDTGSQTQKIDYDALADAILNKLTTKTFDIKSESQTIIAALNALGDASKQDVANNLVTTAAGLVLDARQGKALDDKIASLNSSGIGSLVGVNIDQMPTNNQFGTYWLNVGANTYTGTKPTNASGQGFLIVKRQTDAYVRQTYIGVTGYGFQNRYWDGSTWTEWADMSRYPQLESFSGTPSANGNINHVFPKKVVVLAAWSNASDQTVNAYPSGGVTTGGSVSWWFHCRQANAAHGVVTSEVTITCIYIMLST